MTYDIVSVFILFVLSFTVLNEQILSKYSIIVVDLGKLNIWYDEST